MMVKKPDGTDPLNSDTDGDGTDGQEKTDATDPNDNCSLIVANQTETPDATWTAADYDGVSNGDETNGTDP
jgi:hypothetical protein